MGQDNSVDIGKWLKVTAADGVGAVTFAKLMKRFGSIDNILGASVSQMTCIDGIGNAKAEKIARSRNSVNVDEELELAEKLGVWIINIEDNRYPELLREIYDPPPVLYIKGTLTEADNLGLAIVGSRRCSMYGREQTAKFAHLLADAGFTIYSGMARGIDTVAHQGALAAKGRTIAVQGCGLANVFPSENKDLFGRICQSGCCVSELGLKCEPLAANFPPRNRIIAGMSLGTLVVEAANRSGALITARMSMENNRQVMAVPGKIDSPMSEGPNKLIKEGAALIESVEDILEVIGFIGQRLKQHVADSVSNSETKLNNSRSTAELHLNDNEGVIFATLGKNPLHIEQIIIDTELKAGQINAGLVSLRLKGLIKPQAGSFYVRSDA